MLSGVNEHSALVSVPERLHFRMSKICDSASVKGLARHALRSSGWLLGYCGRVLRGLAGHCLMISSA